MPKIKKYMNVTKPLSKPAQRKHFSKTGAAAMKKFRPPVKKKFHPGPHDRKAEAQQAPDRHPIYK